MRALTLTQPWAGLVASGIKRIENRPRGIIKRSDFGQRFAIHASREIDEAVYARILELAPELGAGCGLYHKERWYKLSRVTSGVIAVATVDRCLEGWDESQINQHRTVLEQALGAGQLRWFFGPVGYVLRDIQALEAPVPCKGALGFWTLPEPIAEAVMEQL